MKNTDTDFLGLIYLRVASSTWSTLKFNYLTLAFEYICIDVCVADSQFYYEWKYRCVWFGVIMNSLCLNENWLHRCVKLALKTMLCVVCIAETKDTKRLLEKQLPNPDELDNTHHLHHWPTGLLVSRSTFRHNNLCVSRLKLQIRMICKVER